MAGPLDPVGDGGDAAAANGRDARGRFAQGNRIARGNPLARRVARLRAALLRAIEPEDIEAAVRALALRAQTGDPAAVRELLDRALGKPEALDLREEDTITRRDAVELGRALAEIVRSHCSPRVAAAILEDVTRALDSVAGCGFASR